MKAGLMTIGLMFMTTVASAGGNSGTRAIRSVHIEGQYFALVSGTTSFANPDGCGNSDGVMIRPSDPQYRDVLASVLMAKATGNAVRFWLSGCANTSWGHTLPIVYSITVDP